MIMVVDTSLIQTNLKLIHFFTASQKKWGTVHKKWSPYLSYSSRPCHPTPTGRGTTSRPTTINHQQSIQKHLSWGPVCGNGCNERCCGGDTKDHRYSTRRRWRMHCWQRWSANPILENRRPSRRARRLGGSETLRRYRRCRSYCSCCLWCWSTARDLWLVSRFRKSRGNWNFYKKNYK